MKLNQKVTDYIGNATTEHMEILEKLRLLIHKSGNNISEDIKWGMPIFKESKEFSYLKANKNHVTLGFYEGTKIPDPNNLLEGDGKNMRHLKFKNIADIDKVGQKTIEDWLKITAKQTE